MVRLTDPTIVRAPLLPDPFSGTLSPVTVGVNRASDRAQNISLFSQLQSLVQSFADESATAPGSGHVIDSGDQFVLQLYVQTHGLTLAHRQLIGPTEISLVACSVAAIASPQSRIGRARLTLQRDEQRRMAHVGRIGVRGRVAV